MIQDSGLSIQDCSGFGIFILFMQYKHINLSHVYHFPSQRQ